MSDNTKPESEGATTPDQKKGLMWIYLKKGELALWKEGKVDEAIEKVLNRGYKLEKGVKRKGNAVYSKNPIERVSKKAPESEEKDEVSAEGGDSGKE